MGGGGGGGKEGAVDCGDGEPLLAAEAAAAARANARCCCAVCWSRLDDPPPPPPPVNRNGLKYELPDCDELDPELFDAAVAPEASAAANACCIWLGVSVDAVAVADWFGDGIFGFMTILISLILIFSIRFAFLWFVWYDMWFNLFLLLYYFIIILSLYSVSYFYIESF